MANDADTQLLINSLKTCKTGLIDTSQSYKAELATCNEQTNKWRITAIALFILVCIGVSAKLKKVL